MSTDLNWFLERWNENKIDYPPDKIHMYAINTLKSRHHQWMLYTIPDAPLMFLKRRIFIEFGIPESQQVLTVGPNHSKLIGETKRLQEFPELQKYHVITLTIRINN